MTISAYRTKLNEIFRKRMYFFLLVVGFYFLVVFVQLINLQFIQYSELSEKSRSNMESYIPVPASRGEIYDRTFSTDKNENNVIIASNRPSFNVSIVPIKYTAKNSLKSTVENLSTLLNVDSEGVFKNVKLRNPWERVVVKEDVPFETIVTIASHQELYPEVDWEVAPVRVYNQGPLFSHLIGYIGSIDSDEYKDLKKMGYKYYQKIGKSGVERQYDELLRGVDGSIKRIVDVKNRTEGEEIGKESVSGNNIVLTVDYEIQKVAHDALAERRGAVVVIKASTGEVLSIVSSPTFDPNQIIVKNNSEIFTQLQQNPDRPFINRPIQARYPPASTFKLITTIAALEYEKWDPNTVVNCKGFYVLKGLTDTIIYDYAVLGPLNLYQAICKSASVYFYTVGYKIGPTIILDYANYFGYSEKTGIDLPGEIAGFVPSKNWKRRVFGQGWYDGDTVNLSIGQGFLNVTPIEVACFAASLVNNGIIYKPHVVKEIRSQDNADVIAVVQPQKLKEVPLSRKTLDVVKTGMRMSVQTGTSAKLANLSVPIAGKTGTAQTRSNRKDQASQHGWFVGFAPYDGRPEESVAIAVIVEFGVAGSASAVPIAEKVFSKMIELGYFNDQKK